MLYAISIYLRLVPLPWPGLSHLCMLQNSGLGTFGEPVPESWVPSLVSLALSVLSTKSFVDTTRLCA